MNARQPVFNPGIDEFDPERAGLIPEEPYAPGADPVWVYDDWLRIVVKPRVFRVYLFNGESDEGETINIPRRMPHALLVEILNENAPEYLGTPMLLPVWGDEATSEDFDPEKTNLVLRSEHQQIPEIWADEAREITVLIDWTEITIRKKVGLRSWDVRQIIMPRNSPHLDVIRTIRDHIDTAPMIQELNESTEP